MLKFDNNIQLFVCDYCDAVIKESKSGKDVKTIDVFDSHEHGVKFIKRLHLCDSCFEKRIKW